MEMTEEHKEKMRKARTGNKQLNPTEKALAKPTSYKYAIYALCYECSNHQRLEIKLCPSVSCPLYNLRPYQEKNNKES